MFERKANDGSFKPFEPVPEGIVTLVVTEAAALPQVNPNTLKLTFADAQGRQMKASWNQDKKDSKGRLTQRYYMNLMVDALVGDATSFAPADLEGKFVEVEIVHNEVMMAKREKDDDGSWVDVIGEDGNTIMEPRIFANIKRVIGSGTPFEVAGTEDELDRMFG